MSLPKVVIIELGSQYTLLIERAFRELGTRSVILTPEKAREWFKKNPVQAVVLSGGAASVYDKDAPQPPEEILSLKTANGKPVEILGICYGMQWLAHRLGGEVKAAPKHREYGKATLRRHGDSSLLALTPENQTVWASHGDSVVKPPDYFGVHAHTDSGTIAAMAYGPILGVQFHPEVHHTEYGKTILENFLRIADCEHDWKPSSLISSIQERVLAELGDKKAVIGFSGGVDSTTLSAILAPVLKDRLLAVTINGGHLREDELTEIRLHAASAGVWHLVVDAHRLFERVMKDAVDAEEKRRRFKEVYAELLTEAAKKLGASVIIQGTLAPDRIESGATGGALIKSHHNVGLDFGDLKQIHPIDHLFKYEVRALAEELGLPESVWARQPFPGPGLFIRVVGTPPTPDKLEIVRWADARVKGILQTRGLYDGLSQLVVAYVAANTVGVKGDARVYGGAIVVRAVETTDFMTAKGVHFPDDVEEEICSTLTRHPAIIRVWFDPTQKPPATTELE
ncbi:MAG: glutamine-hydrolyzing GMP synthase [Candidatus Niyogibacteria bacterium]|nr:glutamine-hydrolyzing GMP synthase [Candidatus Niyogibacteria bacterium]